MTIKQALFGMLAASLVSFGAAAQEYKVGLIPTSSPFTYLDVKTGKLEGVMVDMMNAIATGAGIKIQNEQLAFPALIPSLQAGKIDIMNAAVTITPARAAIIDFSEPLFPYSEGLLVRATDNTPYTHAKEFAGKTVGVLAGTTHYDYLKTVGGFEEIKTYNTIADIMREVETGRLAAGFADQPIIKWRLSQVKDSKIKVVSTYEPAVIGQVALAVKKGNTELLGKLNAEIAKLKSSGRLDQMLAQWGLK